jgi:Tol biopolymer transport system component/predicted Ser/Thr protein kinase
MPLVSGTKLGPYEIRSPLGAGGMGEVYCAHDARLDREVALKVLPAHLSSDVSLKQRLEREAKAVSKLSHPHICTLYDIGRQDGVDFLVMEYLEGETLEQRLLKGPLPLEQALRYAAELADALAKAHKLGVTHRDLKPANVMITKNGAKLMDFGLAKQAGPAPLAAALTEMTMEQSKLTGEGTIVGTFQYMAPEQLEGKEADVRTDIFAFGELLHEMVTGRPAFSAKSRASLIAAILTTDPPPISQLQPLTPPALERIVKKCLAKDPDERWQNASDLRTELKWILESGPQVEAPRLVGKRGIRERWAWAVATVMLTLVAITLAVRFRANNHAAYVVRSSIGAEEGTQPVLIGDFAGPPVVSPDGKVVAFSAAGDQGSVLLWVRPLNDMHARSLVGTEGATFPFWSADSRSLGFFAAGKLKAVSVEGGMPSELCNAPAGRGGSWNANGTILFSPDFQGVLAQVPASGGTPKSVTAMDASKHDSHRWPYFLPDGKHFLYLAIIHGSPRDANDGIYFASLDGKENRLVMKGFTNAVYAGGRLLFILDNALVAQAFDTKSGTLKGEVERVAEDVLIDRTVWRAQFDASTDTLTYASGGLMPWQAMWYDRSGKQIGPASEKVTNLLSVRLSRDGSRLATEAGDGNGDIWIYERKREVNTRITFGPGTSSSPVWSPDGKWIAYVGIRGKSNNLYRKSSNGVGQEELLLEGDAGQRNPVDWSPDGKFLLFDEGDGTAKGQLFLLPVAGERKTSPITQSIFLSNTGVFSPDGHWIAYASNESGRFEVYVIPFGGNGGKWQISRAGGLHPIWRRDGKELFFWSPNNDLMSVSLAIKGGVVEVGATHSLFRFNNPVGNVGIISPYDVSPDGQRLVLITTPEISRPVALVTNWTAELKN